MPLWVWHEWPKRAGQPWVSRFVPLKGRRAHGSVAIRWFISPRTDRKASCQRAATSVIYRSSGDNPCQGTATNPFALTKRWLTRSKAGENPIAAKRRAALASACVPTFGAVADELLAAKRSEWRNEKHQAQWRSSLMEMARPLRGKRVDEIDTEAVLAVLKPLWQSKPETASRLRGRIEAVLDAAKARRYRSGENPAAWRGHLSHLLPKRAKLTRGHHAAMAYQEIPAFLAKLRQDYTVAAMALEFAILTAARSGEVYRARWPEIDQDAKVWTVPASRMKAAREHRVPLSKRALAIIKTLAEARTRASCPGRFPLGSGAARVMGQSRAMNREGRR